MRNNISVAMAVYNGEKYIREQIDSILPQLGISDELVISYNDSVDDTWNIINQYAKYDKRIKIFICKKKGIKANFNNAIMRCKGKYIFLSDQDDVWLSGKVCNVLNIFEDKKCDVVMHDCEITDSNLNKTGKSLFLERNASNRFFKNIIKGCYHGCCIAFSARIKDKILPIPDDIPLHDTWIGLIGNIYGTVVLLDQKLVLYRRHTHNCSPEKRQNMPKVLKDRFQIVRSLICRCYREYIGG